MRRQEKYLDHHINNNGIYGRGINLNEIKELSLVKYDEDNVLKCYPNLLIMLKECIIYTKLKIFLLPIYVTTQFKEVLIVGAFPKKQVYGGIYSSCKLIIDSNQFSEFKIIPFDSSQISNPPPSFIIRFFLAGIRILKFLWILKIKKPKAALIFCSDGPSAIEKGFMTLLCKFFSIKALIFPRAGKLIEQTKKSKLFRNLIKFFFEKTDIFLAQGENWNKLLKINYKYLKLRLKLSITGQLQMIC